MTAWPHVPVDWPQGSGIRGLASNRRGPDSVIRGLASNISGLAFKLQVSGDWPPIEGDLTQIK